MLEALSERLYFDYTPYMETELRRLIGDELVTGTNPLTILEIIGRGAEKPSEIASRMNTP